MKRIYLIAMLIALCAGIMRAENTIFDRYADTDGITNVYISKTMLSLMPNVKAEGMQIGDIATKLDNIRILTCENKSLIPNILKETEKFISGGGYETLMKVNDGGEKTDIYLKSLGSDKKEYIIRVAEASELTFIMITGNITTDDIRKMISKS